MKNFAIAIILIIATSIFAHASTETYTMSDSGSAKVAKILKGKTIVCMPSDDSAEGYKQEEKGFYPVKISVVKKNIKTTEVTIKTAAEGVEFGFGGSELTDVEVSKSWIHMSVGDDGRREFMFQYYDGFTTDGNDCHMRNGKYSGGISGLNSTIWDAGTISAHGIQCCLE